MNQIQVQMFGMTIDSICLSEAVDRVVNWAQDQESKCKFVVTPNVDHAVMFQHDTKLRTAYDHAAMVVADGAPLILASRILGRSLPERVAGSDLGPQAISEASRRFMQEGGQKMKVFLLGAGPGVADRAAVRILEANPGIDVVGTYCPPIGFEKDPSENQKAIDAVAQAKPDLLLVGLGAPKQELWVSENRERLQTRVALCIGATIDFLAGEKKRSPVWMQHAGLEWLHRLLSEPKRLAKRYAKDAWIFPQLIWGEFRGQFR